MSGRVCTSFTAHCELHKYSMCSYTMCGVHTTQSCLFYALGIYPCNAVVLVA